MFENKEYYEVTAELEIYERISRSRVGIFLFAIRALGILSNYQYNIL